jgi:hypothetical protein
VTLAEHYGVPRDQDVTDVEWLADIGNLGWAVFMKDERIRYKPAERAAVATYQGTLLLPDARKRPGTRYG